MASPCNLRCLVPHWEAVTTSLGRIPASAAAAPAATLKRAAAAPAASGIRYVHSICCNSSSTSCIISRRDWLLVCERYSCHSSRSNSNSSGILLVRGLRSSLSSLSSPSTSSIWLRSTSSSSRNDSSSCCSEALRPRVWSSMSGSTCISDRNSSNSRSSSPTASKTTMISRTTPIIMSITSSSSSSINSNSNSSSSSSRSRVWYNLLLIRTYRRPINWKRVRFRARVSYFLKKSLKPKNHSRVLTRFRLTRFGWERLRRGRNGKKFNLTAKQFKNKYSIAYVSRHDLKKFKYQTPGYKLRIRDPPIDTNPNIQSIRKHLPSYFG